MEQLSFQTNLQESIEILLDLSIKNNCLLNVLLKNTFNGDLESTVADMQKNYRDLHSELQKKYPPKS